MVANVTIHNPVWPGILAGWWVGSLTMAIDYQTTMEESISELSDLVPRRRFEIFFPVSALTLGATRNRCRRSMSF